MKSAGVVVFTTPVFSAMPAGQTGRRSSHRPALNVDNFPPAVDNLLIMWIAVCTAGLRYRDNSGRIVVVLGMIST
ncbi:hypothetical protein NITHO_3350007 [Nitrolancea hollandica Lb]|uniref:Uncharacterized protein n=1 Tax=Nitrolancea hollandica Lb TaxID=1129897 RepID=I4EI64_9BACT|nr:hypothetical protein NITHO_3350007 [Nitrolancea hollandica Lb]